MEYSIDKTDGNVVLRISGELNIYGALTAKEAVAKALDERDCSAIIADLANVSEFDTAGLQALVLASREARRLGKDFRVANASHAVAEVLGLLRLNETLTNN